MFLFLSFAAVYLGTGATVEADDVYGQWMTHDAASLVAITDCGDGTPCGTIKWVDSPDGSVPTDAKNIDKTLRDRALVGVEILGSFERGEHGWTNGKIYNPSNGRTYRAILRRTADDSLMVKGCKGPICKELHWTAAPAPDSTSAM